MAFTLPTFNLIVNLWHGGNVPPAPPDLVTVGNLTPGKRTITPYFLSPAGAQDPANMYLLLPRGVDIRDAKGGTGNDLAEVPAGSGRFYDVEFVDDVASGFANEHRFAQLRGFGPWPVPFPCGAAPLPMPGGGSCPLASNFSRGVLYETNLAGGLVSQWFNMVGLAAFPFTYTLTFSVDIPFVPGSSDFGFWWEGACSLPPAQIFFNNGVSPAGVPNAAGSPTPILIEWRQVNPCKVLWSVA